MLEEKVTQVFVMNEDQWAELQKALQRIQREWHLEHSSGISRMLRQMPGDGYKP